MTESEKTIEKMNQGPNPTKTNEAVYLRIPNWCVNYAVPIFFYIVIFLIYWAAFHHYFLDGKISDWASHRRFATTQTQRMPPNALFHRLIQLFGNRDVTVAALGAAMKVSVIIVIAELYLKRKNGLGFLKIILATMVALAMPILFLATEQRPYLGKFAINVIHSPTYLIMVPFALGLWHIFTRRIIMEGNRNYGWIVAIGALGLILAYAKPSFHLAFLPAAALICLPIAIKNLKAFVWFLLLGIALALPILFQMAELLFPQTGGLTAPMGIEPFEVLSKFVRDPKGSFLSSYAFPIMVFLMLAFGFSFSQKIHPNIVQARHTFLLSLLVLAMAFVVAILFVESGVRRYHGNLLWGIYVSGMVVTVEALTLCMAHIQAKSRRIFAWICLIVLALHAYFGLRYAEKIFLNMGVL